MDLKNENRHMVDVLFVLTLFFVFALSAITLVILGASVYRGTVTNMNSDYADRTSYAYVTQKLRQSDIEGSISVSDIGGCPACVMTEEVNSTIYNTYIYEYDGYLYELMTRADNSVTPDQGTKIMELNDFEISIEDGGLYKFTLTPASGNTETFYIANRSSGKEAVHE